MASQQQQQQIVEILAEQNPDLILVKKNITTHDDDDDDDGNTTTTTTESFKALFPMRKNMFTEIRFVCKNASKCMLFQALLLQKLEKAISSKLVSDFQFELKVIIAKAKEEDIISLRLKKTFKTFESVVKFFEKCRITLEFIHTFCIKFYMVVSSTNNEFKRLQEDKTYDSGFIIPNDDSVKFIDWISALLNCDDVPLTTKLSLLKVDSMMLLKAEEEEVASNVVVDDDDNNDEESVMLLQTARSLNELASYAYSVLSPEPVKFALHDENCSCKEVLPTNSFLAASEFPVNPHNPLLSCVKGYGCCHKLDSRNALEQCIDNGLTNVEATGLWSIVKGEVVGDSTSTWLASAGVPKPHDVIGKQKNGEKTTGSSPPKIVVDDDGSEEAVAAAAAAAAAAGSGAVAAAMGVIVESSPSLSNCNDSSASHAALAADDDDDDDCSERQQQKVISTTSKDIEKLTEKEWAEKLILLKQANYKDYKFERTYDDEEQSSVWFEKIGKLDQLRKKKIYEKYFDNLFKFIHASRHYEILERLFLLYKRERFALRRLVKIGADNCKMLYVLPPSEWNWRDGDGAATNPLAAIGIKKMSKSYVKTLPSKSSMSSSYNLKIQNSSFCDNSSRTYNILTVLTLANGKEITFDVVQKNHNSSTSSTTATASLRKRKRSNNTFIEISTQKLKDDDDDDDNVNFKKSKSS